MARVRGFWHGGELSPYETLCLTSFVRHGHEVEIFTYDPAIALPPGVRRREATEILPPERLYRHDRGLSRGSLGGFSDLFRYTLMSREPGWWVDTDVVCLSSELPETPTFFAWEEEARLIVGSAVLRLPPGDPLLERLLGTPDVFRPDAGWATGGPLLLTALLRETGRIAEAHSFRTAFPWHHTRSFEVFDPDRVEEIAVATRGACVQHLWHEHLRRCGFPKMVAPPRGSHMDRLFAQYGIRFPAAPRLEPTQVRRMAAVNEAALSAEAQAAARAELEQRNEELLRQNQALRARLSALEDARPMGRIARLISAFR